MCIRDRNMLRRLALKQQGEGRPLTLAERLRETFGGAREVARPTLIGASIILVVYLPILTLTGIEGKMFRPLAEVALLALAGALLLAFTFVPALTALAIRGRLS